MNRRTFFSRVLGAVAAPFAVKAKPSDGVILFGGDHTIHSMSRTSGFMFKSDDITDMVNTTFKELALRRWKDIVAQLKDKPYARSITSPEGLPERDQGARLGEGTPLRQQGQAARTQDP